MCCSCLLWGACCRGELMWAQWHHLNLNGVCVCVYVWVGGCVRACVRVVWQVAAHVYLFSRSRIMSATLVQTKVSKQDQLKAASTCKASFCNILQSSSTFCNILQHFATFFNVLQCSASLCIILQHSAKFWNVLHHFVSFCNTLNHSTTFYVLHSATFRKLAS